MSSNTKYIFGSTMCITSFIDSISEWVVSHCRFNLFKFKIVRCDPSFFGANKKIWKSPFWTFAVTIIFIRMSLRTFLSIILCSSCHHLYSSGTLVRMSPVKLYFRPCCTIFKVNVSDVVFVQARKLFLKLPPWELSTLMCNSEISMFKFTCFNNPFFLFFSLICLVLLFVVIVVALITRPLLVLFGVWLVFWLIWWRLVFAYYFHCFSFLL